MNRSTIPKMYSLGLCVTQFYVTRPYVRNTFVIAMVTSLGRVTITKMANYITLEIDVKSKLGKRLIQERENRGMQYEHYLTELMECWDAERRNDEQLTHGT